MSAILLCQVYHKRMLERRRLSKYAAVPGDDEYNADADLELGNLDQERGVVDVEPPLYSEGAGAGVARGKSIEAELDTWDENAEDAWDEDETTGEEGGVHTPSHSSASGPSEVEPVPKIKLSKD
jgi:hypothetical protein